MGISGSRRLGGLLGSLAAALPIALGSAPPAAAAEPIELPGGTITTLVADFEGDGARDVVRMVRSSPEIVSVDVWRHASSGWEEIGAAEMLAEREDGAVDVGTLLVTRLGDRDRVLGLTAEAIPGDGFGRICCLSLTEVRAANGKVTLTPLAADDLDRRATAIHAIDLDGDGTDELLTGRTSFDAMGAAETSHVEVHAWRGSAYVQVGGTSLAEGVNGIVHSETDGISGAELLYGPDPQGLIRRLALVDGVLQIEDGQVALSESSEHFDGWVIGVAGGLMILGDTSGIRTLSWPSGGAPREVDRLDTGYFPWIGVLGDGSDALLVHLRGPAIGGVGDPGSPIYDLDLRQVGEVTVPPAGQAVWQFLEGGFEGASFDVNPYPYVGPLPAGLTGDRAALAGGGLLIAQDGEGGFVSRLMSPLAGLVPLGTAGPNDGWLVASSDQWYGTPGMVHLGADSVSTTARGRTVLLPVDEVWEPQESLPASVELVSAAFAADGEHLLSSPDGFAAVLDAPPGTLVITNAPGSESLEVGAVPLTVVFTPPRGDEETNSAFDYGLLAVLPDGRVLVEEWKGTVVREPPSLQATSATTTFALGAQVSGSVSPYAELVVDGRRVEVGAGGAFEVSVDAPPWPVDVVVVARDPLGNETSASVQVIGFADYRGLPWLPIMGLLTVLVGAYALLRVPRRRAGPTPAWTGDGTLEEIELE